MIPLIIIIYFNKRLGLPTEIQLNARQFSLYSPSFHRHPGVRSTPQTVRFAFALHPIFQSPSSILGHMNMAGSYARLEVPSLRAAGFTVVITRTATLNTPQGQETLPVGFLCDGATRFPDFGSAWAWHDYFYARQIGRGYADWVLGAVWEREGYSVLAWLVRYYLLRSVSATNPFDWYFFIRSSFWTAAVRAIVNMATRQAYGSHQGRLPSFLRRNGAFWERIQGNQVTVLTQQESALVTQQTAPARQLPVYGGTVQ
jgi:hypothetical protein